MGVSEPDKPAPSSCRCGGCQCGAVRYEVRGDPVDLYVCHCRECRKQSASAFGISVIYRSRDIAIVKGTPKVWSRSADSGGRFDCFFCPTCGSRFLHGNLENDETVSIKGGSLDDPPDLTDAAHIWTSRKLPGVVIPAGSRQHTEEPG